MHSTASHTRPLTRLRRVMGATAGSDEPKFTNCLIREQSPYLLQHAHNPASFQLPATTCEIGHSCFGSLDEAH